MVQAQSGGDAFNEHVAAQLKARRELIGLSYRELEEKTGLSKQVVMPSLLNRREIRLPEIFKLAPALGLDPEVVLSNALADVRK